MSVRSRTAREGEGNLPDGGEDEYTAEQTVHDLLEAGGIEMTKKDGADEDAGKAAEEHHAEDAPGDLFAPDLGGNEGELDGGREEQAGGDGDGRGDVQEEDQQRRRDGAGTDAGEGDEGRDDEADKDLHGTRFKIAMRCGVACA